MRPLGYRDFGTAEVEYDQKLSPHVLVAIHESIYGSQQFFLAMHRFQYRALQ
jgi:hypothetical protein